MWHPDEIEEMNHQIWGKYDAMNERYGDEIRSLNAQADYDASHPEPEPEMTPTTPGFENSEISQLAKVSINETSTDPDDVVPF